MTEAVIIQRTGRKFEQVLKGARDVFMADGFEGASVDDIARVAGVSKATLYSYFPDKRMLFSEVVRTECVRQACASGDLVEPTWAPEQALYTIARKVVEIVTSEFSLQMFRICVAEAGRFPELGQRFYESGPMVLREGVKGYLMAATARAELKVVDFDLAAEQFLELCKADLMLRAVFKHERDFSGEECHRVATAAVDLFLARFGVEDRDPSLSV